MVIQLLSTRLIKKKIVLISSRSVSLGTIIEFPINVSVFENVPVPTGAYLSLTVFRLKKFAKRLLDVAF